MKVISHKKSSSKDINMISIISYLIIIAMCTMIRLKSNEILVKSMVKSTENPEFKIHTHCFRFGDPRTIRQMQQFKMLQLQLYSQLAICVVRQLCLLVNLQLQSSKHARLQLCWQLCSLFARTLSCRNHSQLATCFWNLDTTGIVCMHMVSNQAWPPGCVWLLLYVVEVLVQAKFVEMELIATAEQGCAYYAGTILR